MPTLLIVVASTRPGRVGLPIGTWFTGLARAHGGFDVEVADLAQLDLPLMDEPAHPRLRTYAHDHTKAWSATVDRADAFALVMPEYNHSFTAPLKNALDYLNQEWAHKPVGFVSYGGIAGGTRAVEALLPVLVVLAMAPLATAVTLPMVSTLIDEEGAFAASETTEHVAHLMLDALVTMEGTLRPLREAARLA